MCAFVVWSEQGCLELACVPDDVPWMIDVTPVDFAARAIVHLAVDQPSKSLGHVREFNRHSFSSSTAWNK